MKKIAIAVAIIAIAFGGATLYRQHKETEMRLYAIENNCTWKYSEYLDREPICK